MAEKKPHEHKSKLNLRQQMFVVEYLENGGNATQAAIAAGYSERTARFQGSALSTNPYIRARIRAKEKELSMRVTDIRRRYEQIASQDIREVVSWGPEGIHVTPSADLSAAAAAAVSEVKERINQDGGRSIEVRMHDPMRALDALAKFEGMHKPTEGAGDLNLTQNNLSLTLSTMSMAELEAIKKAVTDPTLAPLARLLVPLLRGGQLPPPEIEEASSTGRWGAGDDAKD